MPRQLHASLAIYLPDDQFDEAVAKLAFKPAWDALLATLADKKIDCVVKLDTIETRAKAAPSTRKPRTPRTPAAVAPPAETEGAAS